jgi:hypothetical protein
MGSVTYKTIGRNHIDDPLDVGAQVPKIRKLIFTEMVELVNADPDDNGGCSLRPGFVKRYSGDVNSMFANDDIFLFQEGTTLKRLNPADFSSTFLNIAIDDAADVAFCDVNGLVVYSDGTTVRKVSNGIDYALTVSTEEFKEATPAGTVMAVFYRKLLVGSGGVLHVTDPDTVDWMDSRLCRFKMGNEITMIAPVDDGVYVSTEEKIFFLAGSDQYEWSQPRNVRKVADHPAIKDTAVRMKSEKTGLDKVDGNLVMFATEMGYCYGLNGGMLLNATQDKVRPGPFASGTAVLRENSGSRHYLAVLRTGDTYHGEVVNTKTQGAAEYRGYNFKSIRCYQGRYFGCNSDGIFELTGLTDDGADIQASGLSGVSDCGTDATKGFPDAYLTVRCDGELEFSLSVDEEEAVSYPVMEEDDREGVHKRRCKLAKGERGGHVQIGWSNVEGSDFYLGQIELMVQPSAERKVR